jgi:hypothetical protein
MKNRRVPLPKPDPGAQFKPGDFDGILAHLPGTCILIGGQAVALWAEKYAIKTPKGDLVDAASKDIDFWGKHADLFRIAEQLKKTPYLPDKREMTFLVGVIEVDAAGKNTALELLHRVPGLDTDEPDSVAVPVAMTKSGKEALVLTPVSLVLTKLYNLRHFSQEDRHDLLHLQISLEASRAFISEVVSKDPKLALWNCKRLIRAHREESNQRLERQHGFQLLSGIPIESIGAATQDQTIPAEGRAKLQRLLEQQWPRVSGAPGDTTSDDIS